MPQGEAEKAHGGMRKFITQERESRAECAAEIPRGPYPRISDSGSLGWGLRMCISIEFLDGLGILL